VVLDVDGEDGRTSLQALERTHESLPLTLTSETGGGGEQRLFVLPLELDLDAIGNSVRKLGAGLDVRASGGQIVVAPSMHRSGRRYRWAVRVAMAPLPPWLYGLLADLVTRPRPCCRVRDPMRCCAPPSRHGLPAPAATGWARASAARACG